MKKLFLFVSLVLILATLVSCAGETVTTPTASEITNVVPTDATSETTEASEPASTTSQPVVTPPYIAGEPAILRDGAARSGYVIETEDKVFTTGSYFSRVSNGNLYEYYSKVDGEMHVFCNDPNCDHKNFDGKTFTPKCAACLINDPLVSPYNPANIRYYNHRLYFVNCGEMFSADEDGGDVRLEVSISDKREPYEILAKDSQRTKVSAHTASVRLSINASDGQYIYFSAYYSNDNQPHYRFNVLTKELVNIDEKMSALEEKTGSLLDLYTRKNGKIYVKKYKINDNEEEWYLGTKIFEDGIYEITGDFDGIVLTEDEFAEMYIFCTEEGKFVKRTENGTVSLVLVKENGEEEVLIGDVANELGYAVDFVYADRDYIYYTFNPDSSRSLNLSKILKMYTTYYNKNYGKLMRYDRNLGKNAEKVEVVSAYRKEVGTKTELRDENGNVYGYFDLYNITVGTNPYYVTKLTNNLKIETTLCYESERTVQYVRGYYYYKVDTRKTQLIPLIDQKTMKQAVDDGVSYGDTSTYYVDPITKLVYLIDGKIVYDTTETTASKPTFERFKTSIPENEIPRKTTAVIDDIMLDDMYLFYVDYEAGKAIIEATRYTVKSKLNRYGKQEAYIDGYGMIASCDIDGAGNFVNITPMFSTNDEEAFAGEYERSGYSSLINKTVETEYALYSFSPNGKTNNDTAVYYLKADGCFRPLCADPNCEHTVFDGKEVHTACPAAMMTDLYGTYTGTGNMTPIHLGSRFYFVFFQEIYSCDEFGGGLRLEVSLDTDRGQYDLINSTSDPSACEVQKIRIGDFFGYGTSLYFKYTDKNGTVEFYKYDTFTKELTDLTRAVEEVRNKLLDEITIEGINDGKLFFRTSAQPAKHYVTTDDFKTYETSDAPMLNSALFGGRNDYYYGYFNIYDRTVLALVREEGEKEVIINNVDSELNQKEIVFITDDYVYFTKWKTVELGKYYKLNSDSSKNLSGGILYRYDRKTGEKKEVVNNVQYDDFNILFIDAKNKNALFIAEYYEKDSTHIKRSTEYFRCDIDEDGNFVNIRKVTFFS